MNILFFGSSDYCLPVLETLYKNFRLLAVVTKPNQPIGRKMVSTPTDAKIFALKNKIKVFTPKDKSELLNIKDKLVYLKPDMAIVADYGLIIPEEIFNIPKYKTLNIHFSKLPDLRGASPVQYTILRGDKSAWITIQLMDKDLDTGDVIWQKKVELMENETMKQCYNETTDSLYKKLFNIAASELTALISDYVQNELRPIKQDENLATYTKLLTRDDGYIPYQLLNNAIQGIAPSEELLNHWSLPEMIKKQLTINNYQLTIEHSIRAFTPWPGLWTEITLRHLEDGRKDSFQVEKSSKPNKKRLKILKAHLEQSTINNKQFTILVPDLVQLEGKNPVSWEQFISARAPLGKR